MAVPPRSGSAWRAAGSRPRCNSPPLRCWSRWTGRSRTRGGLDSEIRRPRTTVHEDAHWALGAPGGSDKGHVFDCFRPQFGARSDCRRRRRLLRAGARSYASLGTGWSPRFRRRSVRAASTRSVKRGASGFLGRRANPPKPRAHQVSLCGPVVSSAAHIEEARGSVVLLEEPIDDRSRIGFFLGRQSPLRLRRCLTSALDFDDAALLGSAPLGAGVIYWTRHSTSIKELTVGSERGNLPWPCLGGVGQLVVGERGETDTGFLGNAAERMEATCHGCDIGVVTGCPRRNKGEEQHDNDGGADPHRCAAFHPPYGSVRRTSELVIKTSHSLILSRPLSAGFRLGATAPAFLRVRPFLQALFSDLRGGWLVCHCQILDPCCGV
jgi:hypothetical protein